VVADGFVMLKAQIVHLQADPLTVLNTTLMWGEVSNPILLNQSNTYFLYTTGIAGTDLAQPDFNNQIQAGAVVSVFASGLVNATNPAYAPQVRYTTTAAPPPAPEENSSIWSKPWIYIVIAAAVLVVLGVGAYFLKRRRETGDHSKPLLP
jgi:hypothetical protein